MSQSKMEMPRRLRKKWLAALRSGDYKQTDGTLYDTETKGFCCLGVLEHCAMGGKVECVTVNEYNDPYTEVLTMPSKEFYAHFKMPGWNKSKLERILQEMNDGERTNDDNEPFSFAEIADYIEANTRGR